MRMSSRIRETELVTCGFSSSSESPQRMRGKDAHWFDQARKSRITPAHAGKSRPSRRKTETKGDHPRACGEKTEEAYAQGLSDRITPAHAGKRDLQNTDFAGWRDHPRACGEKLSPSTSLVMPSGSPPHMRGKVSAFPDSGKTAGITPAHAEKSVPVDTSTLQQRDHPRTCGEKGFSIAMRLHFAGSPPHMRGKGGRDCRHQRAGGITPAHAGKRGSG